VTPNTRGNHGDSCRGGASAVFAVSLGATNGLTDRASGTIPFFPHCHCKDGFLRMRWWVAALASHDCDTRVAQLAYGSGAGDRAHGVVEGHSKNLDQQVDGVAGQFAEDAVDLFEIDDAGLVTDGLLAALPW
jgi:hypothetical protein